ncbi:response regulator transcription factor [Anoxybacterium hadale]|uniref:Response regulator transcription factor n=1 Tax=Anoxybacterium hadale TaxID=3408580 RepID=A0ACD1A8Y2_9FIRM|nr:response regulator transcription factor [Clostridiales bacterium]
MHIVIIDDHPLVRQGLSAILSMEDDIIMVGEASSSTEGINLVCEKQPDVAIVDLRLGDSCGLETIRSCKEKTPGCKYIILTSSADRDDFCKAEEIGADGYILKEAFPEEIISAVRLVHRGRKYFDPIMVENYMYNKKHDPFGELTSRERDVLEALGEGLRNREIAMKLYITEFTVKKHVSQILAKLELCDRTQAALWARDRRSTL